MKGEGSDLPHEVTPKTILVYQNGKGHGPYSEWFTRLRDTHDKARIEARLKRLAGDCMVIARRSAKGYRNDGCSLAQVIESIFGKRVIRL